METLPIELLDIILAKSMYGGRHRLRCTSRYFRDAVDQIPTDGFADELALDFIHRIDSSHVWAHKESVAQSLAKHRQHTGVAFHFGGAREPMSTSIRMYNANRFSAPLFTWTSVPLTTFRVAMGAQESVRHLGFAWLGPLSMKQQFSGSIPMDTYMQEPEPRSSLLARRPHRHRADSARRRQQANRRHAKAHIAPRGRRVVLLAHQVLKDEQDAGTETQEHHQHGRCHMGVSR